MANNGEQLKVKAIVGYAQNDNGKTTRMYFGGNNIGQHYTDALITSGSDKLKMLAEVSRTAVEGQYITSEYIHGNKISGPKEYTWDLNFAAPIVIHISGQNSVATANDIVAHQLCVEYSGLVNSTPVVSADLKFGTATLLAGVNKDIIFADYGWTDFASIPYTLNLTAVDGDGNTQQVTIVGTPAVDKFTVSTVVDTTLNWSAFL